MKKKLIKLLSAVFAVSLLTCSATALADEIPTGKETATLTVSMPASVQPGETFDVNVTLTGDNGAVIGGATGEITATGLEYVKSTGTSSASKFAAAYADGDAPKSISWTYTYKVTTLDPGEKVSVSASATANQTSVADYAYITVAPGSASAYVSADKSGLNSAIGLAADKLAKADQYTADTVKALKAALAQAQAVMDDPAATMGDVEAATQALYEAVHNLKAVSNAAGTQGADNQAAGSTAANGKDDVPKTGDESMPLLPVVLVLAGAGAVAAGVARRKVTGR